MSSEDRSEPKIRRLFIGNISKAVSQDPNDLPNRISKFGTLKSEFELHHNEVRGLSFAHLDIEISDKDFARLKNALNGVNYKGSKLVIDVAKENYQKRWEADHERSDKHIRGKMLKNQYDFFRKLENINKTFKDRREIIPGRIRKTKRKDIKRMTFRVNFNGEIKTVRCYKTKLWGYEKNKKLRDLVYRFSNNLWKDGNEHIVERVVKPLKLSQNGQTLTIERVADDDENERDDQLLKELGDDEEAEEEKERNNKLLASLLGTFDFDKPLNPKEEDEEYANSDYEYEGALNNESQDEEYDGGNAGEVEYVKEGEFANQKTVSFGDDDDQSDRMDVDNVNEEKEEVEEDDDEDLEFMPTFGQAEPAEKPAEEPQIVEGTISNTETLRTLFNAEEEGSFKLIEESDEDIDQTKKTFAEDVVIPENNIASIIAPKQKNRKGLFFPHFDSPFLVAQTQINKLSTNPDFEEWENSFWDKRSEWTKEFKRRKRDVLRQLRKKNAKNARVVI